MDTEIDIIGFYFKLICNINNPNALYDFTLA